jgi:Zn-finger nucleic acid-binding protein
MNCPKCNSVFEPVSYEGITVDRCTGCKGLWVKASVRKQLRETKGAESLDSGDVRTGRLMDQVTNVLCPECQKPMETREDTDQHHISYEACLSCEGVFLDAGEFTDLKHYTPIDYLKGLFRHGKKKDKQ